MLSPSFLSLLKKFQKKFYGWKTKNWKKSRHPQVWVQWVYGIQNDRLELTSYEFLTVLKTMQYILRNLPFSVIFRSVFHQYFSNISGSSGLFLKPLKTRSSWVRAGRFEYHKPTKIWLGCDEIFSDFSFFSLKIFSELFSTKIKTMGTTSGLLEKQNWVSKLSNSNLVV